MDDSEPKRAHADAPEPNISSEADFHRALCKIVLAADSNGVDVCGGWPTFGDEESGSGWEAEIFEVVQQRTE